MPNTVDCEGVRHATWCDRFGVPTNPVECRRCTDLRDPKRPGFNVEAAARYMAAKRDLGVRFKQSRCPYHYTDGEKEDRVCCGGQVKKVDVPKCRKTGARAECETCTENVMPNVKALAASTAVPSADDAPLTVGVARMLLRENAARERMTLLRERFMPQPAAAMAPVKPAKPQKLILECREYPGNIIMMTALVRDLHEGHPGKYLTDVRTNFPGFWRNNKYITRIADDDREARRIVCRHPIMKYSNRGCWHFSQGFHKHLGEQLGITIYPTHGEGMVRLTAEEAARPCQVPELSDKPFWLVNCSYKDALKTKWWGHEHFQRVVDLTPGIQWVQVGKNGDTTHNPPLVGDNVVNLVDQTTIRDLVLLTWQAKGILTHVGMLMHLSAAIYPNQKKYGRKCRPTVVVAGGREPPKWSLYSRHQGFHAMGLLPCCDNVGCWRDNLEGGEENKRCVDVREGLPACMRLIEPEAVAERIKAMDWTPE